MFEGLGHFFKRMVKQDQKELGSKDAAKERLHLVLMQDRANVSADFLELMKQEIIDVIEKYIVVDESQIDVRLTNLSNDDGTNGAPALFANIPIVNIKNDMVAEKSSEFEGIDFNKEMGLSSNKEEKVEEIVEDTVEEYEEEIDEDEEDDDVTFDDLLKKAEEADKESKETEEMQDSQEEDETVENAEENEETSNIPDEDDEDEAEQVLESEYDDDDEDVEEKRELRKKNRRKKNR
jgi:cell division topological specificity factor